jgi:hypothetical protein
MALFRSRPLSSSAQAKILLVLLLLFNGLCATTTAAVTEAFQHEELSKQHGQQTASNNNPYASLISTSATVQNQDDYFYNQYRDDGLSSSSTVVVAATAVGTTPAPKCWRSAMHVLLWQDNGSSNRKNGPHQQQDAVILCQGLPDSHQKLLALEIARCHMADLGRDLFSTPRTQRMNQGSAATAGEAAATSKCRRP